MKELTTILDKNLENGRARLRRAVTFFREIKSRLDRNGTTSERLALRAVSPYQALLLAVLLVLPGCASHKPLARVVMPKASINQRPAKMLLDTGSSSTILFSAQARQLGLKFGDLSEPTPVMIGGQTFTAQIPIFSLPWFYRLFASLKSFSADGLVGWPEVRDNILVFDADQRTVHGVPQLPPETAGWLKLKVVPNRWLLLEIPLADGTTGTLEVDTGAPFGVELPPKQWKEWKAAHPATKLNSHLGGVLSFGPAIFQTGRADEIKLGTLTLTDVLVQNLPGSQGEFIQRQATSAKAVWAVGMAALRRMDLIVDGKNNLAYIHPKPPIGPALQDSKADALATSENWSVGEDVQLCPDNLFMISGDEKWNNEDFAGAQADYTPASEVNPKNADAYFDRGSTKDIAGDFTGAVSDFDKVLELSPNDLAYARLYRLSLLWRLGRTPEDFSDSAATGKGVWRQTIGQFLMGKLDEKALLEAAKKSDLEPVSGQKCEAYYFIGMMHLSKGDDAGARAFFQQCRGTRMKDYDEYLFAGAELERMRLGNHL